MRNDNAVNRSGGGNGNVIDDSVNWIAQEFEAGNERDVKIAARELGAKRSRMIKRDLARPAVDERAGVKIFDATDPQQLMNIRRLDPFGFAQNRLVSPYHI